MSSHHTRPEQSGVGGGDTGKIAKQRSLRQPLGVKNVMSPSQQSNKDSRGVIQDHHHHPVKPVINAPHMLPPPPRQRKPDVTSAATSHHSISAPSAQPVNSRRPLVVTPASISSSKDSTTSHLLHTYTTNLRSFNSRHPSPLGQAAEIVGEENSELEMSCSSIRAVQNPQSPKVATHSPSLVKTPKKRAIPLEDVHVRNTVPGQQGDSPNANKRSRSSKEDSSATDPSTGTSLSIATGLGDVQLQSYGTAASATLAAVAPRPVPAIPSISNSKSINHASRPTTTRIDKQSRMTDNEKTLRERQRLENHKEWRRKYIKVFPSFKFHLDSVDEASRIEVTAAVTKFGATVEPFFSNTVTHLITARKIPAGVIPDTPAGPLMLDAPKSRADTSKTVSPAVGANRPSIRPNMTHSRLAKMSPAMRKRHTNIPLHSDRNPFEESGPPLPANDILVKARDFNIKIWSMDKFRTVLTGLLGSEMNTESTKNSLAQMLEKEKVASALEKDPLVARDNFHFFPKNAVYILIEDATAEHRAIMVQEWRKPAEGDEPPWPVLYGELEGRCPFTRFDYDGDIRRRMKPNRHETLRRTVSLNHLKRRASPLPSADSRGGLSINRAASPYPLASGNSVAITSNIASTTSNMNMSGMQSGLGIYSPHGALSRKMVLQGNALGLGRPSSISGNSRSLSSHLPPGAAVNDQARGSLVRRMLGMNDGQTQSPARRSISTPVAGQTVRREKKPGYCENCRIKYDDFDDHIISRKHRKFAEDDGHFADIDTMLSRVVRPIASWALEISSPSTLEEHDVSSTSSLLAAGGSLIEAEGTRSYDIGYAKKGLVSPRHFRSAMEEWQQKTHQEVSPLGTRLTSPRLPRSPLHRNVSLPPLENDTGDGDSTGSSRYDNSMNAIADTTATTVTTTGPRTEGEDVDDGTMAIISPHTSPNIHQQFAQLPNPEGKMDYVHRSPRHNFL